MRLYKYSKQKKTVKNCLEKKVGDRLNFLLVQETLSPLGGCVAEPFIQFPQLDKGCGRLGFFVLFFLVVFFSSRPLHFCPRLYPRGFGSSKPVWLLLSYGFCTCPRVVDRPGAVRGQWQEKLAACGPDHVSRYIFLPS